MVRHTHSRGRSHGRDERTDSRRRGGHSPGPHESRASPGQGRYGGRDRGGHRAGGGRGRSPEWRERRRSRSPRRSSRDRSWSPGRDRRRSRSWSRGRRGRSPSLISQENEPPFTATEVGLGSGTPASGAARGGFAWTAPGTTPTSTGGAGTPASGAARGGYAWTAPGTTPTSTGGAGTPASGAARGGYAWTARGGHALTAPGTTPATTGGGSYRQPRGGGGGAPPPAFGSTTPRGMQPPHGLPPPGFGPGRSAPTWPPQGRPPTGTGSGDGTFDVQAAFLAMEQRLTAQLAPAGTGGGATAATSTGNQMAVMLGNLNETLKAQQSDAKKERTKKMKASGLNHVELAAPPGHESALKATRAPEYTCEWASVYKFDGWNRTGVPGLGEDFWALPFMVPVAPNGCTAAENHRHYTTARLEADEEKDAKQYRTALDEDGWKHLADALNKQFASVQQADRIFITPTVALSGQDGRNVGHKRLFSLPTVPGAIVPPMLEPFETTMRHAGVKFSDMDERRFGKAVTYAIKHTIASTNIIRFLLEELGKTVRTKFQAGVDDADWARIQSLVASINECSQQAMLGVADEMSAAAGIVKRDFGGAAAGMVPMSSMINTAQAARKLQNIEGQLMQESAKAVSGKSTKTAGDAGKRTASMGAPPVHVHIGAELARRLGDKPQPGAATTTTTPRPGAGGPPGDKAQASFAPAGSPYKGPHYDPDFKNKDKKKKTGSGQ